MSVEAATFIQSLDSANPTASDKRHQGDDHLRLIKSTLLATVLGGSRALYQDMVEVSVASAATCDVLAAAGDKVVVTGTTTITSFGSQANRVKLVRFSGALLLTHNATTLILPGAANITTAAGDTCWVVSDGSGNVRVYGYQRGASAPPNISSFAATVLDDTSASAARTTLDAAQAGGLSTGGFINTPVTSTLGLIDANCYYGFVGVSTANITIPANADVAFRVGTLIYLANFSSGTCTVTGDTGTTVNGITTPVFTIATNKCVFLLKIGTNTWIAHLMDAVSVT